MTKELIDFTVLDVPKILTLLTLICIPERLTLKQFKSYLRKLRYNTPSVKKALEQSINTDIQRLNRKTIRKMFTDILVNVVSQKQLSTS